MIDRHRPEALRPGEDNGEAALSLSRVGIGLFRLAAETPAAPDRCAIRIIMVARAENHVEK
jgi:hypothetical protein